MGALARLKKIEVCINGKTWHVFKVLEVNKTRIKKNNEGLLITYQIPGSVPHILA